MRGVAGSKAVVAAFALMVATVGVTSVSPSPAGASTHTLTLDSSVSNVGAGFKRAIPSASWSALGYFGTGHSLLPDPMCITPPCGYLLNDELGWVVEFPLADLPSGATITSAKLDIRTASDFFASTTSVSGYAGDGAASASDMTIATIGSVSHHPTATSYQSVDVTTLVDSSARTAGWMGFAFQQSPLTYNFNASWDGPTNAYPPILTIEYTTVDETTTTTSTTTSSSPTTTTAPAATSTTTAVVSDEVTPTFTG